MTKVKTLYVNLKHLINENIMLKTYCFKVHASAIFGPFAEVLRDIKRNVFTFGTWLEDVKISGDITSRIRRRRISKTSLFAALDLKLANSTVGKPLKELIFNLVHN